MLRALLVRWTFSSMAIATVYCAPAAPMSVTVTLPADGFCRRARSMGVENASWQDVMTARTVVGKNAEPNISVASEMEMGGLEWNRMWTDEDEC